MKEPLLYKLVVLDVAYGRFVEISRILMAECAKQEDEAFIQYSAVRRDFRWLQHIERVALTQLNAGLWRQP